MSIRVKQEAVYKGNDRWKWSVWLHGPEKELDEIEYVEYMLHPTFPQPIQRSEKRSTNFRLDSSGWGEFNIYAQIKYKNGQTRKRRHWLTLPYPVMEELGDPKNKTRSMQPTEPTKNEPVLFLSFGTADTSIAEILTDNLEAEGIEVLRNDDAISELPWELSLNSLLSRADSAVVILSERASSWVVREAQAIQKKKIPMIPLIVGSGSELPSLLRESEALNLAQLQAIYINKEEDAISAAHSIAERVREGGVKRSES